MGNDCKIAFEIGENHLLRKSEVFSKVIFRIPIWKFQRIWDDFAFHLMNLKDFDILTCSAATVLNKLFQLLHLSKPQLTIEKSSKFSIENSFGDFPRELIADILSYFSKATNCMTVKLLQWATEMSVLLTEVKCTIIQILWKYFPLV